MALFKKVQQPGPMAQGGQQTPIDPGFMARVAGGLKTLFSGAPAAGSPAAEAQAQATPANGVPLSGAPGSVGPVWQGPGVPIRPVVQNRDDVLGRESNYPVGYNINTQPRYAERGVSFEMLENFAEGLDLVALCIATRCDQIGNLSGNVQPRKIPGQELRAKADDRCAQVDDFLRQPDGRQPFRSWMRQLVHEQLVYDAPTIYVRRTVGGDPYRLEIIQGKTMVPRIDKTGRMPDPPAVAYSQILAGVPAIDYTAEEIIYYPRYRRPGHRYGFSPVEQIIMTINIALRRDVAKLAYFTEGNVPEALVSVPADWAPERIERFQITFDALMQDQRSRSRIKFIPGDSKYTPTRSDTMLAGAPDEWLARVICYAFSLPPIALVQMMNRATAETSYDQALSEGLQPIMGWLKDLLDHIIQAVFGYNDLEWVWDDIDDIDPQEQQAQDIQLVQSGLKSIDEHLIERGAEPIGMGPAIWGIGPLGIMFIDDLLKAKQQGLTMPQPPPPPDMGAFGGAPGAMGQPGMMGAPPAAPPPGQGMLPAAGAVTSQIDPNLLAAVGLGPGGPAKRRIDVTQKDVRDTDPMSRHVAHPQVLDTLRQIERKQGRANAR